MIELEVPLGDRTYPVLVGSGDRHRLLEVLPIGARRAAVVTQPGIGWEVDPGVESRVFTMGDGEDAKHLGTVEDLCRDLAQWGLTRGDVVVAVGGGVVTDTAGFAAPPGQTGLVRATVACAVRWSDLALPGTPGARTVTATFTSPIDRFRERAP